MKANSFFRLLVLGGLVFAGVACQREQPAKPMPKVDSITSSDVKLQHDTAAFNKIMNAPTAPDSVPNLKK
jgi:hypothetical protein